MSFWNIFIYLSLIISISLPAHAQKKVKDDSPFSQHPVYTCLESIQKNPERVYRINLSGRYKGDSIPEAVFACTQLKELSLSRCKLRVINQRIGQLQELAILDISNNRLTALPEAITTLGQLSLLNINRNEISHLPESFGNLTSLGMIDAWDNPLYSLPISMAQLENTLLILDLRQVALQPHELEKMEALLPKTSIYTTSFCPCKNSR